MAGMSERSEPPAAPGPRSEAAREGGARSGLAQRAGGHALVEEAMKKAAVAWLAVDGRPAYAVWCLWLDGALYVVSGSGEQPAPGLAEARAATVSARGDHGGRIVSWPAEVFPVEPGGETWAAVAPQL